MATAEDDRTDDDGGAADCGAADVFARDCPSRSAMVDVAGKWGTLALIALLDGELRFNALRRRVNGVSEKMLSQTLQALERDGMLTREVRAAIPPHVSYDLTPLGTAVAGHLQALVDLVEASMPDVIQARDAYDRQRASA